MYPNVNLFIDGAWKPAAAGKTLAVLNPATGEPIGTLAHAEQPDLDAALDAAQKGFAAWRKVSAFERYRTMRKAADTLRGRASEIATLMTIEQGKPLAESKGETLAGADVIDWLAEEARRTYGRTVPARMDGVSQLEVKEPVGPVAALTPWNFPINQAVRKMSCAIAAGCSIILKGPEETPAACAALVDAFVEAGIPAGVINLVFGVPAEISAYLIPHGHPQSFVHRLGRGRQAVGGARRRAHEARHHGTRRPRPGGGIRRRRCRCGGQDPQRQQISQCRPGLRRASWCRSRSTSNSSTSSSPPPRLSKSATA
jgi:acyl-CoA reductase-like NAD-dependent aldehyde dehydrogenase